jgi:hypothetical protein
MAFTGLNYGGSLPAKNPDGQRNLLLSKGN